MDTVETGLPSRHRQGLDRWAADTFGDAARIENLVDISGNSGHTYRFVVSTPDGDEDLVLRLPPSGVRLTGAYDVVRQVPLLHALERSAAPCARARFHSEDTALFGVPYLIVSGLPGETLEMGSDRAVSMEPATFLDCHLVAVDALVGIHQVDWTSTLADWAEPTTVLGEIAFWRRVLDSGRNEEWIARGHRLADALVEQAPQSPTIGLCHGDFQTNNILFEHLDTDPTVAGVIDWEVASIGPVLLDLGWFLMMNDPQSWDPGQRRGGVDLDAVAARYRATTGADAADLDYFRALAGFRMGAIAARNIMLHRTGRRVDDAWERAAPSVDALFGRAAEFLGADAVQARTGD
ncbi:phosphotransferase family protein [Gordonia McavH-238-E]|uniref:phosphotransferase family protein n=1 Tax=Gordonia sp. McavH-238-E TaxID=2917736 RepID=UPI001EF5A16B|nr:phosphotransferase family protein [Gordonia sp. McavH-238-E]MCG7633274.1 phosphotransferase family protein [Gordonia sp. McavH-238-E]